MGYQKIGWYGTAHVWRFICDKTHYGVVGSGRKSEEREVRVDSRKRGRQGSTTTTTVAPPNKPAGDRAAKPAPTRRDAAPPRLTAKEEQVLRMRYGIKAPPEMKLEFEGQEFDETRLKIAELEQLALEMILRKRAAAEPPHKRPSTKEKIISILRDG